MPRVGLSRARVVDEAAALVDSTGVAGLTLAALADRVGVRQPSLYKHIDSLGGLRRDLAVRSTGLIGEAMTRAAVGRSGSDAIDAMSHAYRRWALGHPGWYELSHTMPAEGDTEHEAATLATIQVIADVLTSFRLRGDDAIDAIRALRATLHGFVVLESTGSFRLSADVERSFDRLVRGFTLVLSNWAEVAVSPATPDAG